MQALMDFCDLLRTSAKLKTKNKRIYVQYFILFLESRGERGQDVRPAFLWETEFFSHTKI